MADQIYVSQWHLEQAAEQTYGPEFLTKYSITSESKKQKNCSRTHHCASVILRKKWAFWIWPIFPGYSRNRQESPPTNTATLSWVGSGADGESERGFPALGRGGLWFWPLGSMECGWGRQGRAGDFSFTSQTGHCDEPWAKNYVRKAFHNFLSLISMV